MRRGRPILAFVHIPKTAGTTVKFILRNSTFLRHCDLQPLNRQGRFTDQDFRFLRRVFFFGVRSVAGHSLVDPTERLSAPFRYFTFLREPTARCLSNYMHEKRALRRCGKDITLEAFLADPGRHDVQVRHIAGGPNLERAKKVLAEHYLFVGLTERFVESLHVLARLAPCRLDLRHRRLHVSRNVEDKRAVLEDPEAVARVRACNRLDLQLYAYVREELYPEFLRKAGIDGVEAPEEELRLDTYPIRFMVTRGFNMGVYRTLTKVRRRWARAPAAATAPGP